jgi:hypothetical protein
MLLFASHSAVDAALYAVVLELLEVVVERDERILGRA